MPILVLQHGANIDELIKSAQRDNQSMLLADEKQMLNTASDEGVSSMDLTSPSSTAADVDPFDAANNQVSPNSGGLTFSFNRY